MNNLIKGIKELQKERGLTDTELADRIGVDRSTWAKIKSGKRNLGMKFLKGTLQAFPQLQAIVWGTPETAHNQNLRGFWSRVMKYIRR